MTGSKGDHCLEDLQFLSVTKNLEAMNERKRVKMAITSSVHEDEYASTQMIHS